MTEIYNLLNSNAITFLCIITFIYVICFLLIRKFSNRHSDFTRYYINNNNIEIEYYYLQANSLEEFFSPKCSKLFSSNIKFKSFEDLSKIFYQVQINKLQEIVHRKIQLLQQHQFNEYHHKEKILLSFSDCSAEERFIECQVEIATAIDNCPVGVVVWFKDVSLDMKYIQKLEIDRDLYSNILNNIPVPIWVRDANNQIFYCNNEYNKIIKLNIKEKIAELTKTSVSITKIARSLKIYSEEKYIITKNERKLFSICEMLFNDNLMLGFALDQSEKERVTKELKQYSDAQNNFLETSSSAIAIYTSDTKIKYFNQAFINLWGLDEKWLFANPTYGEILELLRQKRKLPEQADFSSFKKGHIKLFTQLSETYNEFMYLPDGRALRMIVIPFSLGGVLFAFEDMTSSLALERSFNTLSAVQRAMLNNLSEAIAVFGQDGRLKLYNPAYLKLLEMDEQYASNSPHISDILESKKYLFHVQDSNWINVKNDLISSLYEREFQRTILKMSNDMVIYRNVAPLPDGATLITYMNNSDLVKCQASLNEKKMIINDLFLCQHQFIMSVDKKFHFLHSKLQQEFKKSNIDNINNIDQVFKEIEAQQNEMLSVSEVNLSSINNNSSVIDVNQLIDQSIKKIQNNINVEDIIFSFSDNYHCSMIANHSRINMILDKIFQYVIELTDKAANLHVEVSNDDQKLIVTLIITNSKIIQNALEQKFLLIQSILEVYSEKLLLFCNQDGFKLVLYLSQFQVNQVLEHNAQ